MFALPAGTATMQVPVRTLEINGVPWFVAADVCRCLGRTNPTMALRALNSDEQTLIRNEGQKQGAAPSWKVINESGLYKLVMRSDKPEARKFQDWVARDVLPAIRKDGGYIMGEEGRPMGALRDSILRPTIARYPCSHASAKSLQRVTHGLPEGHLGP